MIPNFRAYNILNESVTLKELENKNKKHLSYGDIKREFLARGYKFLGNLSVKVKTINAFAYDEILNVVPDKDNDIYSWPDKRYIDASIFGCEHDKDLLEVLAEPYIEKASSCLTKKGDRYYVLWNQEKKILSRANIIFMIFYNFAIIHFT